tara:strand:+ start:35 stop:226 length:192 start_codon:yes stop_codon:yes gene_type:complete
MTADIIADLNAERYGRSIWWHKHTEDAAIGTLQDDSDMACARRRRAMAEDFEKHARKEDRNAV